MKYFHQWTGRIAICLVFSMLSACGSLLESTQAPDRTFMLHPYTGIVQLESTSRGLAVDFTVVPGLDTDQMLTLGIDSELNHLADVRWPDHLPELLGSLIRQTLQESGRYSRVSDRRRSALDDCTLDLEAQQFYTLLDGTGSPNLVSIVINGHHECDGKMTPVSLKTEGAVSSRRVAEIVAAYQSAMNKAMQLLHEQLVAAESQP